MKAEEFDARLKEIVVRTEREVMLLVEEAQLAEHKQGLASEEPVSWVDAPAEWERTADRLAVLGGWIYDKLNGRRRSDVKSTVKKIRKALGYTYP
jgi:hypothetical protein